MTANTIKASGMTGDADTVLDMGVDMELDIAMAWT